MFAIRSRARLSGQVAGIGLSLGLGKKRVCVRHLTSRRSVSSSIVRIGTSNVMLPRLNGLEVLDSLRREGKQMPIIVLSAKSGEMDKVTGLELSLAQARVATEPRAGEIQRDFGRKAIVNVTSLIGRWPRIP